MALVTGWRSHVTFGARPTILPVITIWALLALMPFSAFALGVIAAFVVGPVIAPAPAVAETVATFAVLVTITIALLEVPARAVLVTLLALAFLALALCPAFAFGRFALAFLPRGCFGRNFSLCFFLALYSGFRTFFLALLFAQAAGELDGLAHRLGSEPHPVIMVSELEVAFGHHRIARGLCIAPKLHVFFSDGLGRATQFHIGPVGIKDLVGAAAATAASTTAMAVAVAATLVVMLSWSHVSQSTVHCRNQLQPQKSCLPLWVL
jgi:hypothetical protein